MAIGRLNSAKTDYYYTTGANKGVGDPLDKYQSMRPLWERARAVIQGQRYTKTYDTYLDTVNFDNLLLPFSASMTQRQYDFYRSEAELPGLTAQYARTVGGSLLRKGVHLTLPDDCDEDCRTWLINNFCEGKTMHNFLDMVITEELQTSRAWIHVDYPQVDRELTTEEANKLAPYPVLLKPESIINWQVGVNPATGCKELVRVLIRSYEETYEQSEFHPTYRDTVMVHEMTATGYQVRKYVRNHAEENNVPIINGEIQQYYNTASGGGMEGSGDFELKQTFTPLMNGEPMMMIPIFPMNGSVEIEEPILQPLIDREIALYNKLSRRNHLLYGAATYTPVVASDMSDEEFENLVNSGLGSWLRVRADESISALETPTAALNDMELSISNSIEEMARMGIRLLNPEGSGNTSGVALEIRNAAQTGQLGNLNVKVSAQIRKVIALMVNWKYDTQYEASDFEFMLSGDFNPAPLGSDWMRLCTEWYQSGIIPRSMFLEIAKQNDIVPNDYDDTQGQQEIGTDDLIVPVREQFDVSNAMDEAKEMAGRNQQGTADLGEVRERTKPVDDGSGSPER